jgi:hypothetical protein
MVPAKIFKLGGKFTMFCVNGFTCHAGVLVVAHGPRPGQPQRVVHLDTVAQAPDVQAAARFHCKEYEEKTERKAKWRRHRIVPNNS